MNNIYYDDEIIDPNGDYGIYLRKSRADIEAEARGEGETLERHKKMLLDLAANRKIKIGEIYKEIVSGDSIKERPKVQKLLEDVKNKKWKGILVVEVERLARGDTEDQGIVAKAFKFSNTLIVTPMKTYDPNNEFDEEYFEFGLFMSRREYKVIKRRLQNGRMMSVLEGKFVGNIAPFGYDRIKLENQKGYTLKENDETPIIQELFNIFAYNDISMGQAVRVANKRELKTRKGKEWTRSSLKDMYRNPVYIGMIRWNFRKSVKTYKNGEIITTRPRNDNNEDYILVNGLHNAIIDKKTWDIVQEKLRKNAPSVKHNDTLQNPLAGIVYCAKCGRTMQRRPYAYQDDGLICVNPSCDNISSKLKIVEDKIVDALKEWMKEYKLQNDDYISKIDKENLHNEEQTLLRLDKELSNQETKISNVYDFYEEGTYTKEMFYDRMSKLNIRKAEIEKNIKNQREKVREQKEKIQNKRDVVPKIENIIDLYYKLKTAEEKNLLLKSVLKMVKYRKDKRALGKNADPTDFQLDIYPNINKTS